MAPERARAGGASQGGRGDGSVHGTACRLARRRAACCTPQNARMSGLATARTSVRQSSLRHLGDRAPRSDGSDGKSRTSDAGELRDASAHGHAPLSFTSYLRKRVGWGTQSRETPCGRIRARKDAKWDTGDSQCRSCHPCCGCAQRRDPQPCWKCTHMRSTTSTEFECRRAQSLAWWRRWC